MALTYFYTFQALPTIQDTHRTSEHQSYIQEGRTQPQSEEATQPRDSLPVLEAKPRPKVQVSWVQVGMLFTRHSSLPLMIQNGPHDHVRTFQSCTLGWKLSCSCSALLILNIERLSWNCISPITYPVRVSDTSWMPSYLLFVCIFLTKIKWCINVEPLETLAVFAFFAILSFSSKSEEAFFRYDGLPLHENSPCPYLYPVLKIPSVTFKFIVLAITSALPTPVYFNHLFVLRWSLRLVAFHRLYLGFQQKVSRQQIKSSSQPASQLSMQSA